LIFENKQLTRPTVNPYVSQLSPIFKEGVEGGFFIKRTDGTPWQYDDHLIRMVIISDLLNNHQMGSLAAR
jgi:alpha-glucosidase (family GH31 glycosyl hydrolase)